MWARRLGLPPLWPSRLKVIVVALISWWTVSQVSRVLISANVSWLDLELSNPGSRYVRCSRVLDECQVKEPKSPLACILNQSSKFYHYNMEELLPGECDALSQKIECNALQLPVGYGQTEKGKLHALTRAVNPFQTWGILFQIAASLLIIFMVLHDLVLLSKKNRPKILSFLSMKQEFPRLWAAQQTIRCSRRLHDLRLKNKCQWALLLGPQFLWQSVITLALLYPACVVCCVVFPMRMCRLGVFMSGINVILWSLVFMYMVYWWEQHEHWAVFFDAIDVWTDVEDRKKEASSRCICHCEHPLKMDTASQLGMLAFLCCIQSFSLTFRSLKGLRQARWACLFSVTYVVPVEVFPVLWEKPEEKGGGPIQHRKEGEEVQGEPAFDAFALMDEQPESWRTTIKLQPILLSHEEAMNEDWNTHAKNSMDRDIRCCGFPKFHGIKDNDFDPDESSMDEDGSNDSDSSEDGTSLEKAKSKAKEKAAKPTRRTRGVRDMAAEPAEAPPDAENWRADNLGKWRPHNATD